MKRGELTALVVTECRSGFDQNCAHWQFARPFKWNEELQVSRVYHDLPELGLGKAHTMRLVVVHQALAVYTASDLWDTTDGCRRSPELKPCRRARQARVVFKSSY